MYFATLLLDPSVLNLWTESSWRNSGLWNCILMVKIQCHDATCSQWMKPVGPEAVIFSQMCFCLFHSFILTSHIKAVSMFRRSCVCLSEILVVFCQKDCIRDWYRSVYSTIWSKDGFVWLKGRMRNKHLILKEVTVKPGPEQEVGGERSWLTILIGTKMWIILIGVQRSIISRP